jgi:hypothetical protein
VNPLFVSPSDPYARLSFLTQSSVTEKMMKSLCPTWDQTLIFEEIEVYGDPQAIAENPPEVVIEIFDFDKFVSLYSLCNSTTLLNKVFIPKAIFSLAMFCNSEANIANNYFAIFSFS